VHPLPHPDSVGRIIHIIVIYNDRIERFLLRQFRDIHVAVQHNTAFMVHYESAGKVTLGLRPTDPGW
jgi:hypothetical protein